MSLQFLAAHLLYGVYSRSHEVTQPDFILWHQESCFDLLNLESHFLSDRFPQRAYRLAMNIVFGKVVRQVSPL